MNVKARILFIVATAFVVLACNVEKEPNESRPDFIIDSHIHYRGTDEWEKSFIEVFTKYKAMGCVLVRMEDLERGISFAKANPQLVIPYAAIDIDSPTVTNDIRKAKNMGCKTINGWGMLIFQAIAAFEIWTDKKVDDKLIEILYNEIN